MSDIRYLQQQFIRGRLTRRTFLGRAAALGISAVAANSLLAAAARAATPKKGGNLVLGVVGGATTDSLDPALETSRPPIISAAAGAMC